MKKLLILIMFIFSIYFSFASNETLYMEYADIPDTDIIAMNGDIDGNVYKVYIDTGDIFYITGSDNKQHNCFALKGTGYTEKLGEIYFQYDSKGTYVCDDYKLRGVFKMGAGGWGHMEDLDNNSENWKNYLDKLPTEGWYYHNNDNSGNGTGQAFLDGIGISNWDTVRTQANLASYFSNITIVTGILGNKVYADGETKKDMGIILKYNGKKLKNFSVDDIYFLTGYSSDVTYLGKKIPALKYSGDKTSNENGIIKGKVVSFNGTKDLEYLLNVRIGGNNIVTSGTTDKFKPPFTIDLYLKSKELSGKILVGYTNKVKLSKQTQNVDSLSFSNISNIIDFNGYKDYFNIIKGKNIDIDSSYHDLKINYKKFYKKDNIDISYNITGDYAFTKNSKTYKVKNFEYVTNTGSVYKDGKIDDIRIIKKNDSVVADGNANITYDIEFLDRNGWKINNLDFDLKLSDTNKKFDLQFDTDYQTGFFVNEYFDKDNGKYKFNILSYKPVSKGLLGGIIKNINYNGHYGFSNSDKIFTADNLNFTNAVDSSFEDKILKINRDDNIKYVFGNNISTSKFENVSFIFTGYAKDSSDTVFTKGKVLQGTNFQNYDFDTLIEATDSPSAVVYSGYYEYKLSGDKGKKLVQIKQQKEYSPLLFVQSGKIKVLGNVLTNKALLGGIKYVATNINPTYIRNKLKKLKYSKIIRGNDIKKITTDQTIDLSSLTKKNYVYKCSNNILTFNNSYNHSINIYTLGCKINIENNIIGANGHLNLYIFSNNKNPNLEINDGWNIPGNIYIKSSVKTIQASLMTEGSIFTYDAGISKDNIFLNDRPSNSVLKSQLYIKGKVYSKNTLGGGNKYSDGTYMIINGKKLNEAATSNLGIFADKSLKAIAQAYDMTFWKGKFVLSDGTYDTGDLSEYIYHKYNCTGNKSVDNEICTTNIVIEDVKLK